MFVDMFRDVSCRNFCNFDLWLVHDRVNQDVN